MNRRTFIAVAATWLAEPLAVEAQQAGRIPRVGVLRAGAPDLFVEAFRQGLRDLGWVEGQNIAVEYRFAGGELAQLPALAADLVRLKVEVIFAPTFPAALAARDATRTIAVVAAGHADFVQAGLVSTLGRPGGNLTGVTTSGVELGPKRIELLRETLPKLSRVAVLRHPANPVAECSGRCRAALSRRRREEASRTRARAERELLQSALRLPEPSTPER